MTQPSAAVYLAVNAIGFAGALLLLRMVTRRAGEWMTFAHLFSVVWAANLIVAQVALGGRLRPEIATLLVLFAAWWMFLAGALVAVARKPIPIDQELKIEKVSGIAVLLALVTLQLIAFAFEVASQQVSLSTFLGNLWQTSVEFRLDDVFRAAEHPFSFSIWRWGHVFYLPLALALHANRMISGRAVTAVVALAVVLAFGRYTRAPVLQVAVVSLVSWIYLYRPSGRTKLAAGLAIGAVAALAFVVSQVNLMIFYAPSQTTPLESVFAYLGGSPLAYETLLHGDFPREPGVIYTLDAVNYSLYKLSIVNNYIGVVRPFAELPMATNVYTFLDAYTLDAGLAGALLGSSMTGWLVGLVFSRMRTRPSYASLAIYGYLTYCCVMAVANNEFIRMGVFINIGLCWVIGQLVRVRPRTARRFVPLVGRGA